MGITAVGNSSDVNRGIVQSGILVKISVIRILVVHVVQKGNGKRDFVGIRAVKNSSGVDRVNQ